MLTLQHASAELLPSLPADAALHDVAARVSPTHHFSSYRNHDISKTIESNLLLFPHIYYSCNLILLFSGNIVSILYVLKFPENQCN